MNSLVKAGISMDNFVAELQVIFHSIGKANLLNSDLKKALNNYVKENNIEITNFFIGTSNVGNLVQYLFLSRI